MTNTHAWITIDLDEILRDYQSELQDGIEVATFAVLNSAQDFVSEKLRVPWPVDGKPLGEQLPRTEWSEKRLRLYFGDSLNPALELPSIQLKELKLEDA